MAEQEVVKHTKKVYKIWNSRQHSLWYKIKEFLIEIIIIVFAVSFSIWLHDRSEHNHQQKEVKEFLLGLRNDLSSDIKEMNDDKQAYIKQGHIFEYISGIKMKDSLSMDSIQKYNTSLNNTTLFHQNNGRYEGFKSSGKIGMIEDKMLQNNIMDLYQEDIINLISSSEDYIRWKHELFDFFVKNRKRITDSTTNFTTVLLTEEARNLCRRLSNPDEITGLYEICIKKMKTIVSEIDEKYGTGK